MGSAYKLLEPDRSDVVVLVGTRSDDPLYAKRVSDRASVVYVDNFALTRLNWRSDRRPVATVLADLASQDKLVRHAVRRIVNGVPIAAVLCQSEYGLELAARIRRELLPQSADDSNVTAVLRRKYRMRRAIRGHGLSDVYCELGDTEDDIRRFFGARGECLVKLEDGVGSTAVSHVKSSAEISLAYERIRGAEPAREFLIEEYIDGPELSVETWSHNEQHQIITFTAKLVDDNFVEVEHVIPAALTRAQTAELTSCVFRFLDLVGVKHGPTHTEVKLSSRGPRIIESHNRIGGDRIAMLIERVYGVNLFDLYFDLSLGRLTELPEFHARGAAAIRFLAPASGRLKSLEGFDSLPRSNKIEPIRLVADNGFLPPIVSSFSRPGCILVTSETPQQAADTARELADRVRVLTY